MAAMVVQKATAEAHVFAATIEGFGQLSEQDQRMVRRAFTAGYLTAWQQTDDLQLFLQAAREETTG